MRASTGTTAARPPEQESSRTAFGESIGAMDWLTAHHQISKLALPAARSPETQHYFDHLSPFADHYVSPLNPIFLLDVPELKALNEREYWLVRDGLVPLLWFFKTHPSPEAIRSRLFVHRSFASFVPPAWQDHVGLYELEARVMKSREKTASSLLIIGSVMPSYCSIKHLETELKRIVSVVGRARLKAIRIACFLPGRFEGFGLEHSQAFFAKYLVAVCRELGTKMAPISYQEFASTDSYAGFQAIDLNERGLCADSSVLNAALAKGATLLGTAGRGYSEPQAANPFYVPIHPFAGYRIWKQIAPADRAPSDPLHLSGESDFPERSADALRRYASLVTLDANLRYPWPQYFGTWCRMLQADFPI